MTSKRALRGIAAGAIGAGVAVTALLGVEIGAFASTDPKPPSCAVAIHSWESAQGDQREASKARDAAKDESTAAHVELSNAKALPDDDKTKADKVAKAEARVKVADKDLDAKDKALVNAKGRTANRKAEADLACQGKPGKDGKDGAPAPLPATPAAPAPAAPSTVIVVPPAQQQSAPEAPAPAVQDSGPVVTH